MNCDRCDELYEVDGIEPDCENCDIPMLQPENRDLLTLYRTINTAFVKDFSALALVFEVHNIACTRDYAREMLERLILIHPLVKGRQIEAENRKMALRRAKGNPYGR